MASQGFNTTEMSSTTALALREKVSMGDTAGNGSELEKKERVSAAIEEQEKVQRAQAQIDSASQQHWEAFKASQARRERAQERKKEILALGQVRKERKKWEPQQEEVTNPNKKGKKREKEKKKEKRKEKAAKQAAKRTATKAANTAHTQRLNNGSAAACHSKPLVALVSEVKTCSQRCVRATRIVGSLMVGKVVNMMGLCSEPEGCFTMNELFLHVFDALLVFLVLMWLNLMHRTELTVLLWVEKRALGSD